MKICDQHNIANTPESAENSPLLFKYIICFVFLLQLHEVWHFKQPVVVNELI